MTINRRSYERSNISKMLEGEGTTLKAFAEWVGKTQEGVCKRFKREVASGGVSKELECCLTQFVMEVRGMKVKIDIFR